MSSYDKSNVHHINDIAKALGFPPDVSPADTCTYCRRGNGKGFDICPTCGTDFEKVDIWADGYRFADESAWD